MMIFLIILNGIIFDIMIILRLFVILVKLNIILYKGNRMK